MPPFGVVIGEMMADFQACFAELAEAGAGEQFGFGPAPKGFSVGIIVAVTPPAHDLLRLVTRY